ncbi:unnamed protein product [Chondrus crispus]|uniref:Uncharacterized protein n=1 Tax=Chondrus crispus TaxID=2769 RepID=R7QKN3_CHOCR|nr:unnamed protein product [Chondrus crispus]CDF39072.1 unnamed protein product [Chondrus crispus]|eukprot:XP_005718983.1 unnamed protein product [Chondrus crispus]
METQPRTVDLRMAVSCTQTCQRVPTHSTKGTLGTCPVPFQGYIKYSAAQNHRSLSDCSIYTWTPMLTCKRHWCVCSDFDLGHHQRPFKTHGGDSLSPRNRNGFWKTSAMHSPFL